MKRIIRRVGDALLGRGPLPWLGRRWSRRRLLVLAYHGVDDRSSFSTHLDHLQRRYNVVSLDQVLAALNGTPLPTNPVLITFDDGERTVLSDGLPELQARGLPSVLFAIAGFADTDDPFWWYETEALLANGASSATLGEVASSAAAVAVMKQIPDDDRMTVLAELRASNPGEPYRQAQLTSDELRHLDAAGMTVENHAWSHPLLDMCDDEKIVHEVHAASERLSEIIGRPMRAFAYPNGNWDDRVVDAVRSSGAAVAFLFDHKIGPWSPPEPMKVSRVRVNSDTTPDRFAAIASGVHPAFHALQGRS